jgi:hypothetical protein
MSSDRALPSPEYLAECRRIDALGGTLDSVDEMLRHIAELPSFRERFRDEYVVLAAEGPIIWANHEQLAWALGESIRNALRRNRALRKEPRFWAAVEVVAADKAVGKGREPYVMLLGQYGGRSRAPQLMALLDDPEVSGHALHALRLLAAPGAEEKARALLTHRRAWIRQEAKKYLQKVGAAA